VLSDRFEHVGVNQCAAWSDVAFRRPPSRLTGLYDMEKALPTPVNSTLEGPRRRYSKKWRLLGFLTTIVLGSQFYLNASTLGLSSSAVKLPLHAEVTLAKCATLNKTPQPPSDFWKRTHSDRFVQGTKPVLLRNAHIWTGAENGTETFYGSVLLENGLIKAVTHNGTQSSNAPPYGDLTIIDVKGAWITPGSEYILLSAYMGIN
jgi:hypothetical protein